MTTGKVAKSAGTLTIWVVAAAAVGLTLSFIDAPLPFILGAVAVVLLAAQAGITFSPPTYTVTAVQIALGMTVGLLIHDVRHLPLVTTALGAIVCGSLQFGVGYLWFKRRCDWSTSEAILAAIPGAMSAVLALTHDSKAPPQKIIVAHCVRLTVLVCLAGLITRPTSGIQTAALQSISGLFVMAVIGLIALISGRLLERLHVAAPYMITALITAAAGQAFTPTPLSVPAVLDDIAMMLLGLLIGSHLTSVPIVEFARTALAALVALTLCLVLTGVVAYLWSLKTGLDLRLLIFSWVPGSVETMSFAALQSGLDTVFVMSSHITRMLIIQILPTVVITYRNYRSKCLVSEL